MPHVQSVLRASPIRVVLQQKCQHISLSGGKIKLNVMARNNSSHFFVYLETFYRAIIIVVVVVVYSETFYKAILVISTAPKKRSTQTIDVANQTKVTPDNSQPES